MQRHTLWNMFKCQSLCWHSTKNRWLSRCHFSCLVSGVWTLVFIFTINCMTKQKETDISIIYKWTQFFFSAEIDISCGRNRTHPCCAGNITNIGIRMENFVGNGNQIICYIFIFGFVFSLSFNLWQCVKCISWNEKQKYRIEHSACVVGCTMYMGACVCVCSVWFVVPEPPADVMCVVYLYVVCISNEESNKKTSKYIRQTTLCDTKKCKRIEV